MIVDFKWVKILFCCHPISGVPDLFNLCPASGQEETSDMRSISGYLHSEDFKASCSGQYGFS